MFGISDNFNATTPPQLHSILFGGAGFAYLSSINVSWEGGGGGRSMNVESGRGKVELTYPLSSKLKK